MHLIHRHRNAALALLLATAALGTYGCAKKPSDSTAAQGPQASYAEPLRITHELGATVLETRPQRVVALDMNGVDFLDQLGVPIAGMPKDFIPSFLAKYKNAPEIQDTGSIVMPNLERVHAARPDLILITSIHAHSYQELSQIAPTIHYDVNYGDSRVGHIETITEHLITLGQIFGKEDLAQSKAAELDAKIAEANRSTQGRAERALIVLHNNGAYSAFGVQSRYGFVFNALGVRPISAKLETSMHGHPISNEFIQQANPDIIYVIDRTAVIEGRTPLNAQTLDNPLLRQTNAWKTGRVVFADPEAWYITAASPTSLRIIIDDVLRAYRD